MQNTFQVKFVRSVAGLSHYKVTNMADGTSTNMESLTGPHGAVRRVCHLKHDHPVELKLIANNLTEVKVEF